MTALLSDSALPEFDVTADDDTADTIFADDTPTATFADLGLPAALVTALARTGITSPFPIQVETIPDALAGHDLLGRGSTGSGKTLGFGLPMIARIASMPAQPKHPRGLVLVPTRELAMQVQDALEPLAHSMGLRVRVVIGGASFPKQREALSRGVDLVVATPGRLTDLVEQGACKLDEVQYVVLDEADHMADLGFLPAVTALLDQVPVGGQRLLFSATLDRGVDALVRRYLQSPVTHSVDDATGSVPTMEHHLLVVRPEDKLPVVTRLAAREGRTIMFVRTKHGADRLATQLRREGVLAASLHGGKTQGVRTRTLAEFREGRVPVLVATDVAARGIHVDDVSLVVHVDPPADPKDYLHRAGRTARAGDAGSVVTLVLPNQQREVDAMAKRAGITPEKLRTRANDPQLAEQFGAREPSGRPLALPAAAVDTAPKRSGHRRPAPGRARPAQRGPAGPGASSTGGTGGKYSKGKPAAQSAGKTAGAFSGKQGGKPASKSSVTSSKPGDSGDRAGRSRRPRRHAG